MDYGKIKEAAQNYQEDMVKFLRAIVKNPGESCDERKHIETIEAEMKKLNFDEVTIDPQGNVIGYMGSGDKILAFDAHIDTVGIGKVTKQKKKSVDVVSLTSAVVSYLLYTVPES